MGAEIDFHLIVERPGLIVALLVLGGVGAGIYFFIVRTRSADSIVSWSGSQPHICLVDANGDGTKEIVGNGTLGASQSLAAPAARQAVNKWIIGETAKTLAEVNEALTTFRFDTAADALYKFVWGKVCDWYVEFAKPLFDGPDAGETRAKIGRAHV